MSMFNRATLSRYIARRIAGGIFIAFMVVTIIIMLVDFVEGSRDIGEGVTSVQVLFLTLLKTPKLIEQTIPFVVLFGVMGALYNLNRRSELIVMRASGLSAWRFLRPVIIVTGLLGMAWALLFNPFASQLMAQHDNVRDALSIGTQIIDDEVWLREGSETKQTVIRADSLDLTERTLDKATFYLLDVEEQDQGTVFTRRFDAERAILMPQGYWKLDNVLENTSTDIPKSHETISLPTELTPEDLKKVGEVESTPPFWSLPDAIEENEKAGFSALALKMQLNKLLALPVMLIAMSFIAASVSLSLTRQGGTFRLLVIGATVGFGVYFIDSIITAFGEVATIPVTLAAWAIPLLVLLFGITYLSKVEDG